MSDDDEAANLYRAADVLNNQKGGKYRAGRKPKKKKRKPDDGWQPVPRPQGGGRRQFMATKAERI
jgi:hypothetical protein